LRIVAIYAGCPPVTVTSIHKFEKYLDPGTTMTIIQPTAVLGGLLVIRF